jgi:hypothetical protein
VADPTWSDALLTYRWPRDLVTEARRALFSVQSVRPGLIVTPSSGVTRPINQSDFERTPPLLGGADRSALPQARFNSSYIEAIVDDLRRA